MRKNVTIKDIGKAAGVHHTTVSLALRNSKALKKETREKIQAVAFEMGYRANLLAQGFRNRRSNIIGILVPEIQSHFFSKFISEISEMANRKGFAVMVFQSNENFETERKNIEALIDNRVSGIIASISKETTCDAHFALCTRESIPLVFFDRIPCLENVAKVTSDNFQGACDAVTLFIRSGRKNIAFITGSSHINVYHDRLEGYKKALSDHGLPFREEFLISGGFFLEDGVNGAKSLFRNDTKPDAILAVGDDVAIGAIKYLKKAGFRIPEDVAVIGFDNNPMGTAIDPELTTVEQPLSLMAETALQLLTDQIENKATSFFPRILPTHIIQRKSC